MATVSAGGSPPPPPNGDGERNPNIPQDHVRFSDLTDFKVEIEEVLAFFFRHRDDIEEYLEEFQDSVLPYDKVSALNTLRLFVSLARDTAKDLEEVLARFEVLLNRIAKKYEPEE